MRKLLLFYLLLPLQLLAQGKYFIYFKDKQEQKAYLSDRALERREKQGIALTEKDYPVSTEYLKTLRKKGIQIEGVSKWLNAALIQCTSEQLNQALNLPFVQGMEGEGDIRGDTSLGKYARIRSKFRQELDVIPEIDQLKMLGADTMLNAGFNGKDVLVAVMDGGFLGLKSAKVFEHLNIIHTYNYVHKTSEVDRDDTHGTNVLSIIAGKLGLGFSGPAPAVDLALYTTEDVIAVNESKIEEVYWLLAAEHADSLGADIFNTSLGYSQFTDPNQDYSYQDMDGQTSIIARAADYASKVGILVVVAAGNEGNSSWKYISSPADAEYAIAVGAVNAQKTLASFSSIGPSSDGRVKPDVCAMGVGTIFSNSGTQLRAGNGTSYAAPLITGFLASLKQQFPHLTALQLREALIHSADRFPNPTPQYGYGIPSYTRAVRYIYGNWSALGNETIDDKVRIFPHPNDGDFRIRIEESLLPANTEIWILDEKGRNLYKDIQGSKSFKDLKEGLHVLRFQYEGKWFTTKWLKRNETP
jgi:serine protease AprX